MSPVDLGTWFECAESAVELALEFWVDGKPVGYREKLLVEVLENLLAHRRFWLLKSLEHAGDTHGLLTFVRCVGVLLKPFLCGHQFAVLGLLLGLYFFLGNHASGYQHVAVDLLDGRLGIDALVHQRLGITGFVALVVSVPSVAHEVDDEIFVILGTV